MLGQLYRCTALTERPKLRPAKSARVAKQTQALCVARAMCPPEEAFVELLGECGDLALPSDLADQTASSSMLAQLADQYTQGVDSGLALDRFEQFSKDDMDMLVAVGAVSRTTDEFEEHIFKIVPDGVSMFLDLEIGSLQLDVEFARAPLLSMQCSQLSKLEMFFHLLAENFRPTELRGTVPLMPADPLCVCHANLLKSKKYLEALMHLPDIFQRGVRSVSHRGSHS